MWCSLVAILIDNHKPKQGRSNSSYKVVHPSDMLYLFICGFNTCTMQISYVVQNRHQKDTWYDDIVICAQDLETILGAIMNLSIERVYVISQKLNRKKSL